MILGMKYFSKRYIEFLIVVYYSRCHRAVAL